MAKARRHGSAVTWTSPTGRIWTSPRLTRTSTTSTSAAPTPPTTDGDDMLTERLADGWGLALEDHTRWE